VIGVKRGPAFAFSRNSGSLARAASGEASYQSMPELPDITAYLAALAPRILGKTLQRVRLQSVFVLRTADPPITAVEGKTVRELRRVGKRICFGLSDALVQNQEKIWLVIHLMIAGRLHWRPAHAKLTGRQALAGFDFLDGTLVLTEAGSKRRASLHLLRGQQGLQEIDPGGIEIFSPEADLNAFRAALSIENRTLKRALTDPRLISGVGNAYSDEILHAAQLSPVALTHKLKPEEWERLYAATRTTLEIWIARLTAEAGRKFPEGVTAFRPEMAVHGRFGRLCPRCGSPIQRIRYADNETNYCATCQTGGKVLADRSLSRLLGSDWPRTLEELEALKRR
jgi:formamidopyrimidine-DNA glycosylase